MKAIYKPCLAGLTGIVLGLGNSAALPQSYPTKAVRLIAPSPPGSPPDVVARLMGEKLAAGLGQPLVVENRPGAVGTIGLNVVAKAPADGYTLGLFSMPYIVAPSLVPKMPYDLEKDLAAVSLINLQSHILAVPAGSAIKTIPELIAAAKAKPGYLKYSSGGNGTPVHLDAELFKREAGVFILHIPYNGAVGGVTALIAGDVDMMFGNTTAVLPQVKSGKLRALATAAPRRIPSQPDLPTLVELGYPNVAVSAWDGVVAPAGTPKQIVARLHHEIQKVGAMPETRQRFEAMGNEAADMGPEEFAAFFRTESQGWNKLMRDAGIKPD